MSRVSLRKGSRQVNSADFNKAEENEVEKGHLAKTADRELKSEVGEVINGPVEEHYGVAAERFEGIYLIMLCVGCGLLCNSRRRLKIANHLTSRFSVRALGRV